MQYTMAHVFLKANAVQPFFVFLGFLTDVENQLAGFATVCVSVEQVCVLNSGLRFNFV